jgi:hypothetical protein
VTEMLLLACEYPGDEGEDGRGESGDGGRLVPGDVAGLVRYVREHTRHRPYPHPERP